MELVVRHKTTYFYTTPASQVALLLRLHPARLDGQDPRAWAVTVNGTPVEAPTPNAFGDLESFYQHRAAVGSVVIVAEGTVETWDRQGIVSGFRQEVPLPVYLRATSLTGPDPAITALAREAATGDDLSTLHGLSSLVRERVAYLPGSTSTSSTASEALAQGAGVCQDHAHLFVTAARSLGIPARYVAGYLLADHGEALHETHAWAEAWVPGLGWIGFDPTNGLCVTDHYVRLCGGLDAHDAAPVRGSVYGATAIVIHADVAIGEAGTQQMQQQQ
jgi:transglutaminase-like putative cysteine protease